MSTADTAEEKKMKSSDKDVESIALQDNDKAEKYRSIFNEYGEEGMPIEEVKTRILKGDERILSRGTIREIYRLADADENNHINFEEFRRLLSIRLRHLSKFQRTIRTAVSTVVPRSATNQEGEDLVEDYIDHYSCKPPPLFMILISLIEIGVFIYYAIKLKNEGRPVTWTSGISTSSPLIFNPQRRYEAWRFLSYMLMHVGIQHLVFNLIFQLLLGIPLELVHKWWRMLIIYGSGVVAGSMMHTIFDQNTFLAGASGGCYALIGAHFATVIMNWKEMTHDWMDGFVKILLSAPVRILFWSLLASADIGVAIYKRYVAGEVTHVGYAAHFGGALAGLLIGIPVLKNIKIVRWERVLFWVCIILYFVLIAFGILWNIFYKGFPKSV